MQTTDLELRIFDRVLEIINDERYEDVVEDTNCYAEIRGNLKSIVYTIVQLARKFHDEITEYEFTKYAKQLTQVKVYMKF